MEADWVVLEDGRRATMVYDRRQTLDERAAARKQLFGGLAALALPAVVAGAFTPEASGALPFLLAMAVWAFLRADRQAALWFRRVEVDHHQITLSWVRKAGGRIATVPHLTESEIREPVDLKRQRAVEDVRLPLADLSVRLDDQTLTFTTPEGQHTMGTAILAPSARQAFVDELQGLIDRKQAGTTEDSAARERVAALRALD